MTVGELLENNKPVVLGVLGAGILFIFSFIALFLFIRTGCGENLDRSGEAFARQAIETITTWDHEAVLDLMPPNARDRPELVSYLKNSCTALRIQLGPRTGPVQIDGDAKGRFDLNQMAFATGIYSGSSTFRYGTVTVSIQLYKNVKIAGTNGPWLLLGVRFTEVGE